MEAAGREGARPNFRAAKKRKKCLERAESITETHATQARGVAKERHGLPVFGRFECVLALRAT